MTTPAAQSLIALFDAGAARRPGRDVPWLDRARREALDAFRAQGIPTTRLEDWRFTSLARLEKLELRAAGAVPLPAGLVERARACAGAAHSLVFANGRLQGGTAALAGTPVESLHRVLADAPERAAGRLGALIEPKQDAFAALNLALVEDGAWIEIAPGANAQPIHLIFAHVGDSTPRVSQPRVGLHAGADSRAILVEHHVGLEGSAGLSNAVSELWLAPGAQVEHVVVQDLPREMFFMGAIAVHQEAGSAFAGTSLALGAGLARLASSVRLAGEGARARLDGLYLARGSQLLDHHTTIDHAVPNTTSRELYKGVLDERGRGVFHGRVHVRPDAQRSDAAQINRALLLSDGAQIDTKPQLEIYADDVRCSHGASVGQLDEAQLFYLRARGIAEREARALLTAAFAREVLERLPLPVLRDALEARVLEWLPRGGAA
jgi:Fe-S cluster assembly protein SufD